MAGQSRLASISDHGSVQSTSWMENVDDTLSHTTEKVWVNLNVWLSSGGQVSKTAGPQACSVHHILCFVHPRRHHALPCQGRKRKNSEKKVKMPQDFAHFVHYSSRISLSLPTSHVQFVLDLQILCLKICTCSQRHLAFKGTNQRCSSASGQGNMLIRRWYRCIGGIRRSGILWWRLVSDVWWLMSLMSPVPCDSLPCFHMFSVARPWVELLISRTGYPTWSMSTSSGVKQICKNAYVRPMRPMRPTQFENSLQL